MFKRTSRKVGAQRKSSCGTIAYGGGVGRNRGESPAAPDGSEKAVSGRQRGYAAGIVS